jgi:membrane associated rhomboid family serine protease
MDRFPPVVKNLIIINILVWVAQLIYDRTEGSLTMFLTSKLALYPVSDPAFEPYQIATHMFCPLLIPAISTTTILCFHILFNMFGLYMFGRILKMWNINVF